VGGGGQTLSPDTAAHWLNRALCYVQQEKWDLVLADCVRALALDAQSVRGHYYRGLAHLKLGSHTDAVASLKTGTHRHTRYACTHTHTHRHTDTARVHIHSTWRTYVHTHTHTHTAYV
jgi:hypothetical protein